MHNPDGPLFTTRYGAVRPWFFLTVVGSLLCPLSFVCLWLSFLNRRGGDGLLFVGQSPRRAAVSLVVALRC
jgi:hypothetical protein